MAEKDQSLLWTESHLDLVEVGDMGVIVLDGDWGKIIWRREINRSYGLRATWTWLRWMTGGLSCRWGIGKDQLAEKKKHMRKRQMLGCGGLVPRFSTNM